MVTIFLEHYFDPDEQLMQMPATAHSVPKISKLLLDGLQLYDEGMSHPRWVWL